MSADIAPKLYSERERSLTAFGIAHAMHTNRGIELNSTHILRCNENILCIGRVGEVNLRRFMR